MAQTCGAIVARRHLKGARKLVYFMTIDTAKFRKPVVPGDVLRIRVEKLKQRNTIFKFDCNAFVGEDRVAQAIISAMMVDPEDAV
jgi:3-hydroxyacyl-[acyl-carrier-protein] dehydratase